MAAAAPVCVYTDSCLCAGAGLTDRRPSQQTGVPPNSCIALASAARVSLHLRNTHCNTPSTPLTNTVLPSPALLPAARIADVLLLMSVLPLVQPTSAPQLPSSPLHVSLHTHACV